MNRPEQLTLQGQRGRERRAANGRHVVYPGRLRSADLEWIAERLSARDWQIMTGINQLRLLSGRLVERLYFEELHGRSKEVVRGRVLRRLVRWQVLAVLPRRIGGAPRGSAGAVYALGNAGVRLCLQRQRVQQHAAPRVRRPELPTERTVAHTLAVSELYAAVAERARHVQAQVHAYSVEPQCWWPTTGGPTLKPDAYTLLALGSVREHWWIEVDLATESLPTIKRKLLAYLAFVASGQTGPHGVLPRVLVTAPTEARCRALQSVAQRLPPPAAALFVVCPLPSAANILLRSLQE